MTIFSKNLGGLWPLCPPPGYAHAPPLLHCTGFRCLALRTGSRNIRRRERSAGGCAAFSHQQQWRMVVIVTRCALCM